MTDQSVIRGRKVVLRRVEERDHPDIQRWQNDPDVFRMMDYERPFSLEDIHESEAKAAQEGIPLIIEVDGNGVGRIGLNNFRHRDGLASLYLFVGERSAWGQGVGLDAVVALLRYGFDELALRRIELWTLGDNDVAIRLYKRAGFIIDATIPERSFKEGQYVDHVVMSVDRESAEAARLALDD